MVPPDQTKMPNTVLIMPLSINIIRNFELMKFKTFIYSFILPYILESNPHPFYSFRGLKIQVRIRIAVVSWIFEKR